MTLPHDKWTSTEIADHTRGPTASEKLMMLRLPAVLGLLVGHMKIRATKERLDPQLLTEAAHELLELASQAERAQMREGRAA